MRCGWVGSVWMEKDLLVVVVVVLLRGLSVVMELRGIFYFFPHSLSASKQTTGKIATLKGLRKPKIFEHIVVLQLIVFKQHCPFSRERGQTTCVETLETELHPFEENVDKTFV